MPTRYPWVGLRFSMSMDSSPTEKPETLTFPARYDSLAAIDEFVSRAAEAAGLDERAVYAVQMATDEAFSNIIKHAYGGEGRGVIECTCRVDADRLIVTLRDHGRRFDPASVPEP
ncbi:MAG: hypothetical protein GWN58_01915, partial [Anaerolineae bacterium]|nr:hypothetical protein [Anaerolineae bacterium]